MEKQNKIRFSKKLWWSITKISKYDEMMETGLKESIKYFVKIIAILALILSIFGSYIQSVNVNEVVQYLNEKLPEISLEKKESGYEFTAETEEVVILDESKFIDSFKTIIIINNHLKEKEAIDEYYKLANEKNNCAILLKDKCILITQQYAQNIEDAESKEEVEGITEYNYSDLLTQFTGSNNEKYTKVDVLNYLGNVSYTYYIMVYFINYFVILLVVFALDVIVISVLSLILSKILKIQMDRKKTFSMSIYSLTLTSILYIGYLIASYFTKYSFAYINIINMIIAYIYVSLYFYTKKKKCVASE